MVEEKKVGGSNYKSIEKNRNEMVKIIAKFKSWILPKSRSENFFKTEKDQIINIIGKPNFSTLITKLAYAKLSQAFIYIVILEYFDQEYLIQIEINISSYTIKSLFSQLTIDLLIFSLPKWYFIAYFFRKMILTKTKYQTYDYKLLAIIEAFKTCRYYLKDYKYNIIIFIDYNRLCKFIDIKKLSSCYLFDPRAI